MNETATDYLLRLIARRRTNYLVETVDIPVASGQPIYPIPSVAMAGALRSVVILIGNVPFALIEMDLPMAAATNLLPLQSQYPVGYYFINGNIQLWPTQAIGGTLRIHYHRRPSVIVRSNTCIKITSLPGGAAPGFFRLGFASAPTTYAATVPVDLVSNVPNFYRWMTNAPISAITGTTMDLPGTIPASLAVGDWICLYDTAPLVTDSPAEVINCYLEACACEVMKAKGLNEGYSRMLKGLELKESYCGPLIKQRNTGSMRKVSAFPEASGWPFAGF
jgi:hypothetical protein